MIRSFFCVLVLVVTLGIGPLAAEEAAKSASGSASTQVVEPGFTDSERAHVVGLLEKSRSELETLAAKVGDDQWTHRTDPERWSVGEVVEHLVLAEEGLFAMATGALQAEADPEWTKIAQAGVDQLINTIQDRSQKFQAPEFLEPKAEATREAMLARFAEVRTKTLDFVRSTKAPVKQHTATGPPGKMNIHQWLVLIGAHNLRHNQQMADVIGELD